MLQVRVWAPQSKACGLQGWVRQNFGCVVAQEYEVLMGHLILSVRREGFSEVLM